jgi:hypothetical protein
MSRRANVARLPLPLPLSGELAKYRDDARILHEHMTMMTTILNQALQSLQNRTNTIQQVGARAPVPVSSLAVTGKQGLFWLTWNRIAHVDGYVVVQASDAAMTQVTNRYPVPDGDACSFAVPVGNVAVTASFQVYAYQGPKYSDPSPIITATTLVYASSEAAPGAPPIAPRQPKLAPIRSGPNL